MVVALPCLHPNSPQTQPPFLFCAPPPPSFPYCLCSPFPLCTLSISRLLLHLVKWRELGEEAEEWSVSSPLHIPHQRGLLGLQPTDLGIRQFWTGAICHCHPWGRVASWGLALRWWNRIWVSICVRVYHPELLGTVIHINEHLWLTWSMFVEMLYTDRPRMMQCLCIQVSLLYLTFPLLVFLSYLQTKMFKKYINWITDRVAS